MTIYIKDGLSYTADHDWIDLSADSGNARVGITPVAARSLGEIEALELPEVGAQVAAGEACGQVEGEELTSEIVAPVSGTVVAVNDAVIEDPTIVTTDPFGDGWLYSVRVEDDGDLLDPDEYAEQNEGEVI